MIQQRLLILLLLLLTGLARAAEPLAAVDWNALHPEVLKKPVSVRLVRDPFLAVPALHLPVPMGEAEQRQRERLLTLLPGKVAGVVRSEVGAAVLIGNTCYPVGASLPAPQARGRTDRVRVRIKNISARSILFLVEDLNAGGSEVTECSLPLEQKWWAP